MVAPQATLYFPHGASYIEHRLWVYSLLGCYWVETLYLFVNNYFDSFETVS